MFDVTITAGKTAVILAWVIFALILIAVIGAMLRAMFGEWEITYLHTGNAGRHSLVSTSGKGRTYRTGRHRPEYVRTHGASAWIVKRYEGMVTA